MKEIAYVDESNGVVRAFDKNHHILVERAGDLVGYTSTTVSIDDGYAIQVYRAEGGILRSLPSKRNSFSSRKPDSNVNKSDESNSLDSSRRSSRERPTGSGGDALSGGDVLFLFRMGIVAVPVFILLISIVGFSSLFVSLVIAPLVSTGLGMWFAVWWESR